MQRDLSFRAARNLLLGNEKLQRLQNRPKTRRGRVPSPAQRSEAPQIGIYARPGELRPDEASGPTSASKHERSEKSAFELGENRLLTLNSFSNDKLQRLQRPKHVGAGALTRPAERSSANWFMQDQPSYARPPGRGVRAYVSIKNTSEARARVETPHA